MSINSIPKVISIIDHRKAFRGQRIAKSSCVRKETINIEILITPREGDKKIMQPIKMTSGTATKMRRWNQFSQFR